MLVAAAAQHSVSTSYDPIAGWTPVSDVVEHWKLDLDTLAMEIDADLQTDAGFLAAYEVYSDGGNRCVRGDETRKIVVAVNGCAVKKVHCYLLLLLYEKSKIYL